MATLGGADMGKVRKTRPPWSSRSGTSHGATTALELMRDDRLEDTPAVTRRTHRAGHLGEANSWRTKKERTTEEGKDN
jgi:hypothetical protein